MRPQPSLLSHWKTAFCLSALLLAGGCVRNAQKTGNISEPKDRPLAVDWKYLRLPLNDVFFIDTKRGWGAGEEGLVLATQHGGRTWERRESRTQSPLNAVWFVNDRVGWIVGNEAILSTRDGGLSWAPRNVEGELNAVHFINRQKGWAVGDRGVILSTSDGGKSWEAQDGKTTTALKALQFVDENTGWAVGDYGTIIHTRDGGRNWTPQKSPERVNLSSVFFVDKDNGWISCFRGVLQTSDGGKHWISNLSIQIFERSAFIDPRNGIALASDLRRLPFYRGSSVKELKLLGTEDGGKSWIEMVVLGGADSGILRLFDRNHGYVFDRGAGTLSWTTDGGKTWTPKWDAYPDRSLQFLGPRHGWGLSSDGRLLLTNDGGGSWNQASGISQPLRDRSEERR